MCSFIVSGLIFENLKPRSVSTLIGPVRCLSSSKVRLTE
jgi:hypothetical protein